jgi:hypothetical protein
MGSGVSCLGEQAAMLIIKAKNKMGRKVKRGACFGIRESELMTDWLVI